MPHPYINRKGSCFLCSLLIRSHSNRSVDCLATTNHCLVPANDSLTPANHSLVPANNKVLKLATWKYKQASLSTRDKLLFNKIFRIIILSELSGNAPYTTIDAYFRSLAFDYNLWICIKRNNT